MTRVILVRHGQTEWNRVERFRQRADVLLNETGLAQAAATARRMAAASAERGLFQPAFAGRAHSRGQRRRLGVAGAGASGPSRR